MNFPAQTEKTPPSSFPIPLNNPAGIVIGVGKYEAALGGCEGIQAKSHYGRSPHWASGAAESRRNPDDTI
nr:hypothetical protein CFP56_05276 [Quercus suber]